ncbi:MAG TPA: hypothetical protein VMU51_12565 [Mycobacteriales bacterium]|nr:hypothetical protein [Mycobacteriales bacterium]
MSFQTSALILSWVAILLLALVVSGLVRQVHVLSSGLVRPAGRGGSTGPVGLAPGALAPGLDLLGTDRSGPVLLLFLSADCHTCSAVLTEAAHLTGSARLTGAAQDAGDLSVRALYAGPAPATDLGIGVYGGQAELFERYDAIATPFAVLVDPSGRVVRSEPVGSPAALRTLLDRVVQEA